jgi:predicted RNase H-like nuclease
MDTVLGVDACKTGWVGIAWSGGAVTPLFAPTITELVDAAGAVSVIGIDIPIGLPDRGCRQADLQAREFIGARRSSVFLTPVRATLGIRQHQRASAVNQERTGKGLSIQAFSLLPKIQEVDDWKPTAPCQVVEVHPEVSFTQLGDEPPPRRSPGQAPNTARHSWPRQASNSPATWARPAKRRWTTSWTRP